MNRGMHKIVIVKRRTRLEDLKQRFNTVEQARFYVEHLGADFADYELEYRRYYASLEHVRQTAGKYARVQEIDKEYLLNMIFGQKDLVITVGQDGLAANVMKYLDGQPLLGVNPDPGRFDGVLLPFAAEDLETAIPKILGGTYDTKDVTMGKAEAKDGQVLYAVNDFFAGVKNHTSARYRICYNGQTESQSSSGLIISTGLGMTGWHRSIMAEFNGMAKAFGLQPVAEPALPWDAKQLIFQVREPYPSISTQASLVYGRLTEHKQLVLVSEMPENGVLFSDGILDDTIEFNAGMEIKIGIAEKKGRLVTR